MQNDRANIYLLVTVFAVLGAGICFAIFGMHREFAIAMLAVGLIEVSCARRLAAAQHVLADRPNFPNGWKKSTPRTFLFVGAAMTLLGVSALF